jgi:hypothetical protein
MPGKFDSVPDALRFTDKIKLAELAAEQTEKGDLNRLDLKPKLSSLCDEIRRWNRQV